MTEVNKKVNKKFEEEMLLIEQRKTKALEKIAHSLDALTIWFEEIDKQDWSDRIQYYLSEWHKTTKPKDPTIDG
jgi:hypothetical protein